MQPCESSLRRIIVTTMPARLKKVTLRTCGLSRTWAWFMGACILHLWWLHEAPMPWLEGEWAVLSQKLKNKIAITSILEMAHINFWRVKRGNLERFGGNFNKLETAKGHGVSSWKWYQQRRATRIKKTVIWLKLIFAIYVLSLFYFRPWNRTNMANACQMLERELIAVVAQESENYKVSLAVSFLFKFFNVVLSKTHLKKVFIIRAMDL